MIAPPTLTAGGARDQRLPDTRVEPVVFHSVADLTITPLAR